MMVALMLGIEKESVKAHRGLMVCNELDEVVVELECMWILV